MHTVKRFLFALLLLPSLLFAQARDYNGTTDQAFTVTAGPLNVTTSTFCAWLFPDTLGETSQGRFVESELRVFRTLATASIAVGYTHSTTSATATAANNSIVLGVWNFVCTSLDASKNPKIYVGNRATPVAETSYAAGPVQGVGTATTESYFAIVAAATAYDGRVAHASLWDQVLTVTQMDQLRLQPYAPYWTFSNGGTRAVCKGYWPMSESSATVAKDHCLVAHMTTISGGAVVEGAPYP